MWFLNSQVGWEVTRTRAQGSLVAFLHPCPSLYLHLLVLGTGWLEPLGRFAGIPCAKSRSQGTVKSLELSERVTYELMNEYVF